MMGRLVRAQDRLNDALRADDDAESFAVEPRLAMAVNA
jgi:hypothetical protein